MPETKRRSNKPKISAITAVDISTIFTEEITSSLLGHTTFFNSAIDSLKKLLTFPIIKTPKQYAFQARKDSNPQHSVLETDALPLELLTYLYYKASITKALIIQNLFCLCFFVHSMLLIEGTILIELKFPLNVFSILVGCIIPSLALATLQCNYFYRCFFCHYLTPYVKKQASKSLLGKSKNNPRDA